jgi:hypothetical protein
VVEIGWDLLWVRSKKSANERWSTDEKPRAWLRMLVCGGGKQGGEVGSERDVGEEGGSDQWFVNFPHHTPPFTWATWSALLFLAHRFWKQNIWGIRGVSFYKLDHFYTPWVFILSFLLIFSMSLLNYLFHSFSAKLGIEFRTTSLLGKCSTTWVTASSFLLIVCFSDRVLSFCLSALDLDLPTFASCVVGIIAVNHHAQQFNSFKV